MGLGLPNTANLFVPFFTTKPEGSGIGLVLSRQIAEGMRHAHAAESFRPRRLRSALAAADRPPASCYLTAAKPFLNRHSRNGK